jgi:hypothetical protein
VKEVWHDCIKQSLGSGQHEEVASSGGIPSPSRDPVGAHLYACSAAPLHAPLARPQAPSASGIAACCLDVSERAFVAGPQRLQHAPALPPRPRLAPATPLSRSARWTAEMGDGGSETLVSWGQSP